MFDICNYYEQLVTDQLWLLQERSEQPLSQSVLEDVACLALNSLPPCYVRNLVDKGAHMSEKEHAELRRKTEQAIQMALSKVQVRSHEHRDT